jgi:acyl carrier protein
MTRSIQEIIAEVIDVDADSLSAESGPGTIASWDSLATINIVTAIEEEYQIKFTVKQIVEVRCIADLEALVVENTRI